MAVGAVAVHPLLLRTAQAQGAWPNRPVKIFDGFAPGSSADYMARMVASKLSVRLGQQFVVENRPGAGGTLGTDAAAKAAPDGYTLLLTTMSLVSNAASGKQLPFDYLRDLTPVGPVATSPLVIVVPVDSPFKTLRDMIEHARAKPNDIRYNSSGVGSISHIGMELLAAEANVKMTHVPYRGNTQSLPDLVSGQIHAGLGSIASYSALLDAGKLRMLAATSAQRSPLLPNVPTGVESGYPGFQFDFWFGVMAPARTPPDIIRRLNTELNAALAEPETRQHLQRVASVPKTGTPEEFGRMNASEFARWQKVIRDANISVD